MKREVPMHASPCRHWPFWIVIAALAATLGISLLINLAAIGAMAGTAKPAHDGWGEDEFPQFSETHSYGSGTTKVLRIAYTGIMTRQLDGGWLGTTDPVEDALRQIRAARQNDEIAAILLEIDSPGGEVTAADEIHRELTLFKASREDRKITVLVHDMAASGGYYIALPADRILAQPTALIGSIGVILQTLNIQGLSEKLGITDTTIKSGKNKDMLNPFRPVDPEQVGLLQASVDAMHDRFLGLVAQGRSLDKAQLKDLADGRLFTADEALAHRLIDGIGYWDEAMAETAALLGVDEILVVAYQAEKTFFDRLFGARAPLPGLHSLLSAGSTPRRLYLWRP
jgi:protease IV